VRLSGFPVATQAADNRQLYAICKMTDVLLVEFETIRGTFRGWHSQQDSLDAQLADSLAALAAYQSHLDAWQQQLAREREELQASRDAFARERAAAEQSHSQLHQTSSDANAELSSAREKITGLSTSLLERTEELRVSDQRRAELATELELTRAREQELGSALEDQKRVLEAERAHWADELRNLRETLERRPEAGATNSSSQQSESQPQSASRQPTPRNQTTEPPGASPVLGSIMQQFGKLRQQRAVDREALRKAR
jgi:chromosome segregation ATPase